MKRLQWFGFCLLMLSAQHSSAQSATREKVIGALLEESRFRIRLTPKKITAGNYKEASNQSAMLTHVDALPKYALPKGNVVCRLEEYVQLHTPMKLNIGVGGQ